MDYSKILRDIDTKLARQREAVQATEQHRAAIEQLIEASKVVQDKSAGRK